jgi:hypothetical protein
MLSIAPGAVGPGYNWVGVVNLAFANLILITILAGCYYN